MQPTAFYSTAHLIVAAIRVLEYQQACPPSIDSVCKTLSFSKEQGNFLLRKLNEIGIIDIVDSSYGCKLYIKDHLIIENIPKGIRENKLEEELKKFQNKKSNITEKIESFESKHQEKKKKLFAEFEKQLKQ